MVDYTLPSCALHKFLGIFDHSESETKLVVTCLNLNRRNPSTKYLCETNASAIQALMRAKPMLLRARPCSLK